MKKQLLIQYQLPNQTPIEFNPKGDWIDLRAAETVYLKQFEDCKISLGVSMKLPKGYEAHVKPRSSTYKTWGILLVNGVATIDECYCGPDDIWFFHALAMRDTVVNCGERICQFRIVRKQPRLSIKVVTRLFGKNRGGWGSTGTK